MATNDGGPAFPRITVPIPDAGTVEVIHGHEGMSLRDYFAAAAPPMQDAWYMLWAERESAMAKAKDTYQMREPVAAEAGGSVGETR